MDVAVGPGAEPGGGISGRLGDRVQPVDLGAIRDARAVRIPIGPPVAPLRAGDAGGAVIGIDDPRQGVPLVAVDSPNARSIASFRGADSRRPISAKFGRASCRDRVCQYV